MESKPKAVVLLSGGLDSALAAKVLADQGVEVHGVHFNTGFCVAETRSRTARPEDDPERFVNRAQSAGRNFRFPVREVDISSEFLDMVLNPPHGYGSNVNPCIDCRILMLRKSAEIMREIGAEMVATGEVIGQRPMSQHRGAMNVVEREAGLEGRLLRPLSAHRMTPTVPEAEGRVDRSRLLGLWGRGRKAQMALAREAGFTEFVAPGGGCCFLTDANFARRFRDRLAHRGGGRLGWEDMELLKVGRQLRLGPSLRLVVGRHEAENNYLERFAPGRARFEACDAMGPLALADEGLPTPEEELLCASILARYGDGRNLASVRVEVRVGGEEPRILEVAPFSDEERLTAWRL